MSASPARRAGPLLILAGGLLIAAGTFLPQVIPTGLDRSHWSVLKDNWADLFNPNPLFPREYTILYCGTVVIGLSYPVAAGLLIAAGGFLGRSRVLAAAAFLLHAGCLWILAAGTLALASMRLSGDPEGDAKNAVKLIGAGALLAAILFIEIAVAFRAARAGWRRRSPLVDLVNLPPAAFLFTLQAGLFLAFRKHPNWPSAGYAVSAAGALLVLAGIIRRRVRSGSPPPTVEYRRSTSPITAPSKTRSGPPSPPAKAGSGRGD